jgi:hypothetical protein
VSLTVLVSVTGSFLTTTSSFTYGSFDFDFFFAQRHLDFRLGRRWALRARVACRPPLDRHLFVGDWNLDSLVSVVGSLIIVASSIDTRFETCIRSSITGIFVSISVGSSADLYLVYSL